MGIVGTLLAPFRRSVPAEGEPRPGPYVVSNPDGLLPDAWGQYINYWQLGYDPIEGASSAVVEACVAAYANAIAQCPGDHWRALPNGGRERVTNSALSRFLRWPNSYQSRSDFVARLVRDLYQYGNYYGLARRNSRFEVAEIHPFNSASSEVKIAPTGDVFYKLAGNNVLEAGGLAASEYGLAPARNVLHLKLETVPGEPLNGIAPLKHASAAIAAQKAIGGQLLNFFANMSRPPGVIETDLNFSKEQVTELRGRLDLAWKGIDKVSSGPPILTNGMKWKSVAMSARESEVASALKLTQSEILMVYGVPPAILGIDAGALSSTEALMNFWLSTGLGFAINHIEVGLDQFFGLKGWPEEYVEFDTRALLRVAYKDRIEALARGTQGGIYSPNEARRAEELPDAKYGDEPRVQQQVVPLSAWAETPKTTPAPDAPPAPPSAEPNAPDDAEPEDEEKDFALIERFTIGETRDVTSRAI